MYAIVDIETTGSHPADNGITEIAIVLHNGTEVEGVYETLINPGYLIPPYVVQLTGITNNMVATAPPFAEVAGNIHRLLQNRIFIAHNVNFDYSFIKYHLREAGYEWNPKKLCTLKLSRKAFPNLPKYGLGHLCRTMNINIENRHRAGGDAKATAVLFTMILEKGGEKMIKEFLKKENREQILPPNLPSEQIKNLPYTPGVYYFHDEKHKVIYVGKAKNIKQRVVSHFTGLNAGKKRQEFLRTIHSVTYKECATELMAFIFESIEIKRLWPKYNDSQKTFEHKYGIYMFEDSKGYQRLAIDKKRKYYEPLMAFNLLSDANRLMWRLVKEHELHPALCFLDKTKTEHVYPEQEEYNNKVQLALQTLQSQMSSYAVFEQAAFSDAYACILVENGKFYGMGTLPENINITEMQELKKHVEIYPENEMIRTYIRSYIQKNPAKVLQLKSDD
jgi:DNA polymerase-3 subunit epsilon